MNDEGRFLVSFPFEWIQVHVVLFHGQCDKGVHALGPLQDKEEWNSQELKKKKY